MASRNGIISIRPSEDGVMRGEEPYGGAGGYVVGTWTKTVAPFYTNWPFADIVKSSEAWRIHGGTGTYAIDRQDRVTQCDQTLTLRKWVVGDSPTTIYPLAGTYRVRWTGTAQVTCGGGPEGYAPWSSPTAGAGEFTFNLGESADLYFYIRGGTINSLECVHSSDLTTYDSGQIWRQAWLDKISSFNIRIVRPLINENYTSHFNERTEPACLTYGSFQNLTTGLHSYQGTNCRHYPWEVQADLANRLNCDLAINIPAFATLECIRQTAEVIDAFLEPHRRVFVELSNETWNYAEPFYQNLMAVGMNYVPKITLSLTPGTNSVVSPGHGFSEGELFRPMTSPYSGVIPTQDWYTNGTTLRAINVTADTFEAVVDSTSLPAIVPTDVVEVYAWKLADHPDVWPSIEEIDRNTGTMSVAMWDAFKSGMKNPGRAIEIIGSQQDWLYRSQNRTGPLGTNGRYDFLALGCYFGLAYSVPAWQEGDSLATMLADGIIDVDMTLASFDSHISNGYLARQIFCYEGGQHYLPTLVTVPEGQDPQVVYAAADTAFRTFMASQEMATLYDRLHQGLADRGVWGGCTNPAFINPWGYSGYWYGIEWEEDPFDPRVTLMVSYNGVVEPTP